MNESHDRHQPSFSEDVAHASAISLSALLGLAVTGVVIGLGLRSEPVPISVPVIEVVPTTLETVSPTAGADRIFGTVTLKDQTKWSGYLVWDSGEASWADLVPATRLGSRALAGIRFGHVDHIGVPFSGGVTLSLKNGLVLPREWSEATGLTVVATNGDLRSTSWSEVESVDFRDEPVEFAPLLERAHGTVVTRTGLTFEGDLRFGDNPFLGDRRLSDGLGLAQVASVSLGDGPELTLHWSDAEHAPVSMQKGDRLTVSDAGLGSVEIPWERVREIRLHEPEPGAAAYEHFDGGVPLSGTVTTTSGVELQGPMRWDLQEAGDWEMLDGQFEGLQFHVEFSRIAWIKKTWMGSTVGLVDGRSFYLIASNDVNAYNAGIEIMQADGPVVLAWNHFSELRMPQPR